MPVGVLIDVGSVFLGGLLGGQLGSRLPEKLKKDLTLVFGVSSMAMGVTYLGKVSTLPAVILSVILGLMIGETVHLDGAIRAGAGKMNGAVSRLLPKSSAAMDETRMHQLVSIIVLICASGTGIFGALDSGLTGDHTVLCTKAILDFFTAAIFASSLGSVVAFVALPQLILQLLLFFSAGLILPLASAGMQADFAACGGVLMLVAAQVLAGPLAHLFVQHQVVPDRGYAPGHGPRHAGVCTLDEGRRLDALTSAV